MCCVEVQVFLPGTAEMGSDLNYSVRSEKLLGLLSFSSLLCLTGGLAEGTGGLRMPLRVSGDALRYISR